MDKSFTEIYNEVNAKYGKEIAEIQHKHKKVARLTYIFSAIVALAFLLLFKSIAFFAMPVIIFVVIAVIIFNLLYRQTTGVDNYYKNNVINALVQGVYPNAQYTPNGKMPSVKYNARAFSDNYDRYSSEDFVNTNNKYDMVFAEVLTEVRSEDSDGDVTYTTSFSGIYGFCNTTRILKDNIYITNNGLFSKNVKSNVQMDMTEFEKNFDVYCSDKILAMQLLTSDIMVELLNMKEQLNARFEFAIEKDKIYFRIHTGNNFEMKIYKDSMGVEVLKSYFDLLKNINKLVNIMNKNIEEMNV